MAPIVTDTNSTQSILHMVKDYGSALNAGANVSRHVAFYCVNGQSDPSPTITLKGHALVDIGFDKDNDIIGYGYGWLNSDKIQLFLARFAASDIAPKKTTEYINPIIFWSTLGNSHGDGI